MSLNHDNAVAAWGAPLPRWVELLAKACDASNQREAGRKIGRSSATVSKVVNRCYPGNYAEIEQLVLSQLGGDRVLCPIWRKQIPLVVCMRERRRKVTRSAFHMIFDDYCPTCPNNLERFDD
jgi:hypothetical protein